MGFVRATQFAPASFSGTSIPLAITAPAIGNSLILVVELRDTTAGEKTVSSIADNGTPGSTWAKAVNWDSAVHILNGEIWYALEVKGSPTTVTLTVAGTGVAAFRTAIVMERDDILGRASLVERTATNLDISVPLTIGPTASTTERELIIGVYTDNQQNVRVRTTGEFTERANTTSATESSGLVVAERIADPGLQSCTFDSSPAAPTVGLGLATFKLAIKRTATDTLSKFVENAKSTLGATFVTAFQPNAFQGSNVLQLVRTAVDTIGAFTESAARAASARVRTGADTLGALTETAGRATSASRTAVDTLGSLTESAARGALSRVRTATDTLGTMTESAARSALNFIRTGVDTLGSFAETVARAGAKSRTVTDTLDALTEVAIGLKIIIRTATDSLGQLTESAARSAMSFLRTATDTVSTLTESTTRVTSAPRTAADTLQAFTESAVRAALQRVRTAVDTIGSLSETVARSFSTPRTAVDALGSFVETVARAGAKSRVATDTLDAMAEVAVGLKIIIRTAVDTLGAFTETAARAATSRVRTATDTISDVTETVARAGAKVRTATDTLGSFTEAAVGLKIIIRTAVDTLSSFTETATRSSMAFTRTATDTVGALTETATRGATARVRTAVETLATLSESVVRSTAAGRTAVDTISALSETVTRSAAKIRSATDTLSPFTETALRAPRALVRSAADVIGALIEAVTRLVSGGAIPGRASAKDYLANSVAITDRPSASVAMADRLAASVSIVDAFTTDRNLVANGWAQSGTNANWSQVTYDAVNTLQGHASFKASVNTQTVESDALMPIDPARSYVVSYWIKATTYVPGTLMYAGLSPYDIDNFAVESRYVQWINNSLTTLAAPLAPGATTVTLTSAANWQNGDPSYQRAFLVWDYTDGQGKTWPTQTYSRHHSGFDAWAIGGISGNVVTLRVPWVGFGTTIPAGTPISCASAGSTYNYTAASNVATPNAWTQFQGIMNAGYVADGTNPENKWRQGTRYAKMLMLLNRNTSGNVTNFTDVVLEAVATVALPPVAVDRSSGSVGAFDFD